MGLAHNVRLKRPIKRDQVVSYVDVDLVNDRDVAAVRHEIEDRFKPLKSVAAQ
jgi:predicted homoserine dehydrogenase-like protein